MYTDMGAIRITDHAARQVLERHTMVDARLRATIWCNEQCFTSDECTLGKTTGGCLARISREMSGFPL